MLGVGYSPTRVAGVSIKNACSEIVDFYFCSELASTTIANNTAVDDITVVVTSATGIASLQCINISQFGHTYQALIKTVVGTTLTLSAPLDRAFTAGSIVKCGSYNMNLDGSVTKQYFNIAPPAGVKWDICRIIVGIVDNVEMDDAKFGGIPALPNGVILRKKNGVYQNIFQVSDNSGWRERCFDVAYADKAPNGSFGFGCRRSFNGMDKNGVVIRLDGDKNDKLQFINQDDLTGLTKFACVAQGHVVEE